MTACTEPNCQGTVAADGYCDTCGAKPAAAAPAVPLAAPAPLLETGDSCGRNGCGGTIAADGYCDTCGLAAAASGSGRVESPNLSVGTTPSIAAPAPPTVSARLQGAGSPTARSRRTTSRRTGTTRSAIGRGLVEIAPTPVGDPGGAVMSAEKIQAALGEIPEADRVCSSCGRPVGRSVDGSPGRVTGFCGTCRTPFDFVTNEPALESGELVAGQYEILGPLAHGGMGWIYLGRDKAVSDRWVVLKGLLNESDPDAALAAVAERQFLAQIEHPNIVNIYNFVTHRGAGYIVMEMVGGESLNAKLKDRRKANGGIADPLPPIDAIAYILGILPAFGYLHGLGLVYNDLKPANIMAVADDVRLIDVGAVMRFDDPNAAIFGTSGFQAPEVPTDGPSIASDLYTVGRTLAVLILRFVFHDGTYLYALPDAATEPLLAQWESLNRFLLRACAYHRDDRFQDADEMAQQLTGVLRELVAVSDGVSRSIASALFGPDQLTNLLVDGEAAAVAEIADIRVLPQPKVDPDDPAAAFLLDLPDLDATRTIELIDRALANGDVEATIDVRLRKAAEQIALGQEVESLLTSVAADNPWEWRVTWYRALSQFMADNPAGAAELFSQVWTELPGELAPKLAVALAAEAAGEHARAAELYDSVIAVDSAFVSAAFGLARCRTAMNDRVAAVAALGRVPASSAAHYDAQIATAETLTAGDSAQSPSAADLHAAATTIERLQLDAQERARLATQVFEQAIRGLESGEIAPGSGTLLGHKLDSLALRSALEETYRHRAKLAGARSERHRLVDQANRIRPRSLL